MPNPYLWEHICCKDTKCCLGGARRCANQHLQAVVLRRDGEFIVFAAAIGVIVTELYGPESSPWSNTRSRSFDFSRLSRPVGGLIIFHAHVRPLPVAVFAMVF